MTLAPGEQRTLLRMERSLARDPALAAALDAFRRRRFSGRDPAQERLSPWHPVMWQAVPLGAVAVLLVVIVLSVALAAGAHRASGPVGGCAATVGPAGCPAKTAPGGQGATAPRGTAAAARNHMANLPAIPLTRLLGVRSGGPAVPGRHAAGPPDSQISVPRLHAPQRCGMRACDDTTPPPMSR